MDEGRGRGKGVRGLIASWPQCPVGFRRVWVVVGEGQWQDEDGEREDDDW